MRAVETSREKIRRWITLSLLIAILGSLGTYALLGGVSGASTAASKTVTESAPTPASASAETSQLPATETPVPKHLISKSIERRRPDIAKQHGANLVPTAASITTTDSALNTVDRSSSHARPKGASFAHGPTDPALLMKALPGKLSPPPPPQGGSGSPPNPPTSNLPADGATGVSTSPTLKVNVSDPNSSNVTVNFYGKLVPSTPAGSTFSIIALPDTQYYSSNQSNGTLAMFNSQTQWIVNNRVADNIAFVIGLGDIVQDGNNNGDFSEWINANSAVSLLDNPNTTGLPQGIPYSFGVGNHDQGPTGNGAPDDTAGYNTYFGTSRYSSKSYYGGHFGTDNDNHYELFSAGGMDFIVINIAYMDPGSNGTELNNVLAWANGLLQTNSTRRGIVVSHYLINDGFNASWSNQGQVTYNALKGNPNLFLMLAGHWTPPEGQRADVNNGNRIFTFLSDYQEDGFGGDGWLRILTFVPSSNQIQIQTYSPFINQSETSSSGKFTVNYDMHGNGNNFTLLASQPGILSGGTASFTWPSLAPGSMYEWYVTVSNSTGTAVGPLWSFTTGGPPPVTLSPTSLTFASQQVNTTSAAQSVTLTNTGTAALSITSIAASAKYTQTNNCPASPSTLAVNGACTINVTFTPTAVGSQPGTITITDNATGSPQTVNLNGNGTAVSVPAVNLSATSLTFGSQQLDTASAAQTVTLTNTGAAVLNIASIIPTGDYAQTNTCGMSVAAGANCTISVTFTPTATGTRTGAITITDNATGSPQTVNLTGTGSIVTTSSIRLTGKFTEAMSGSTSVSSQTVSNTGFAIASGDLIVVMVRIGSSGESTTTCSDNINAGNYIQAHYQEDTSNGRAMIHYYKANSASAPSGALTITCRYPAANHSYLGALDYSGAATSNPLDGHIGTNFLAATTSPTSGSITPTQSGDLFVGSLYLSESSTVTVSSESTGFIKELTGNEGTANFQHSHTADEVSSSATAQSYNPTFSSSLTTIDIMTAYKASSSGSASVSFSPTSLSFGNQNLNTTSAAQTVTLTNGGAVALSITSIAVSAPYAQTNTCGTSVAAGANCTISVTFTPTATGSQPGTITVTDNAAGSPQTVNLTGTGVAPSVSFSPMSLSFGNQNLNTTSAAQTVILTNTQATSLSITSIAVSTPYAQTNTCGTSVAAGANCTISVTFTPTAIGSQPGMITVMDNAAGSPQTVNLTGTGSAPMVNLSSTSLHFASRKVGTTSTAQTVTLTNTGNALLSITSIAVSGDFSETTTCGSSLAAGSSCKISVKFAPTATGTRTGAVTINDTAAGSPHAVSLTGTGK
jgi:hypothetical protein